VKNSRVAVEKLRKELKADALKFGQTVDAEARRITGLLTPIETHLDEQESAYNTAKEAIKNAARLKAEAEAKANAEAEEAARLKAIAEENARLAAERAELQRQREAMEAERASANALIAAQQKKIDDACRAQEAEAARLAKIESDRLHAIEVEKARVESAEKARIETEQRIARETAERERLAKLSEQEAEAKRLREEALRPDKEKLLAVADTVAAIKIPAVSVSVRGAAESIGEVLAMAAETIRNIVGDM